MNKSNNNVNIVFGLQIKLPLVIKKAKIKARRIIKLDKYRLPIPFVRMKFKGTVSNIKLINILCVNLILKINYIIKGIINTLVNFNRF